MRARQVLRDLAPNATQRLAPLPFDRACRATHVVLCDAPAWACAPDRAQVDPELLRDSPDERGRLHLLWQGSGRLAIRADQDQRSADRDELALADQDLRDLPRGGRGDLDGRLVGLDLDERVVLGDLLPDLDEPARDLALAHALAQVGKLELVGHQNWRTCWTASTTRAGEGMCSSSIDQKGNGTS